MIASEIFESIGYYVRTIFNPEGFARRYGISGGHVEFGDGSSGFVFRPSPLEGNPTPYLVVEVPEGEDPILKIGRLLGENVPDVILVAILERQGESEWRNMITLLVPINPNNPQAGLDELRRLGLQPADIYDRIVYGGTGRFYDL
ncbi:hypothetical protein [Thermoflexus sp.]|uniref:hypothetical protein n=1 Tax=Thermoflexus sp. TaxID=1969742 RepID=UPI002ADD9EAF|nr:hypothetical protein [Thermoflexus sp.]